MHRKTLIFASNVLLYHEKHSEYVTLNYIIVEKQVFIKI